MSDLVVRRAEPRDAAELVRLASAVGGEPGRWLISTSRWRSVSDERRYLRSVRRSVHSAVYLAEAEGVIVGRLSISRDPHPACLHVADVGLMVDAAHRRRGIGTALLETAVDWSRRVGVSKIELHVFPHNEAAIALYEKFGFEREGYRWEHYLRAGQLVDAILMAYRVAPYTEPT